MVANFLKLHSLQLQALPASGARPGIHHLRFPLLHLEDVSWAGRFEGLRILGVLESGKNINGWHKPVESSGDRRPLGVPLSNPLFSVNDQVNLLVLSQLSDKDIGVQRTIRCVSGTLIATGNPLDVARVH